MDQQRNSPLNLEQRSSPLNLTSVHVPGRQAKPCQTYQYQPDFTFSSDSNNAYHQQQTINYSYYPQVLGDNINFILQH